MKLIFFEVLPFLTAFSIGFLFTLSIIDLANKKRLFEANSNIKQHTELVCSLGGISIFSAFWIAACLFSGQAILGNYSYLFVGSFILFLTGVRDDMVGLPPMQRLLIQIGVASLMFFGGIQLTHLPGITAELPFLASYFLTITLIGAIVNAFNFIDGINGLAGGLAVISSLAFSALFFLAGVPPMTTISLALAGAVLGFLYFNFGKAKIFMGDNGSTFIGIMCSFMTIVYLNPSIQANAPQWVSPAILLAVMFVPLIDMVKVIAGRILRRKSPVYGDLTHIHHLLSQRGLSASQSCAMLYSWNIGVVLISFLLLPQDFWMGIGTLLVVGGMPYLVLVMVSKPKKQKTRRPLKTSEAGDYI